jgi:hypothetical protein
VSGATYTVGELARSTTRLLYASPLRSGLAFLCLTAFGMAADAGMAGEYGWGAAFLISILSLVLQYWLTRAALEDIPGGSPGRRFAAFVVLGVVSQLAIAVGFLLLIVPGIVLMVRWWISFPVLLDTELTVFEALGESWRRTERSFWPILGLVMPLYLLMLLALGAIEGMILASEGPVYTPVQALAFNVTLTAANIFGWYVAVAAYDLTARPSHLSEIFT